MRKTSKLCVLKDKIGNLDAYIVKLAVWIFTAGVLIFVVIANFYNLYTYK